MHLVADPEGFKTAAERNLPFYRTACGSAAPRSKLVVEPNRVTCPLCLGLISKMRAEQAASSEQAPQAPTAPVVDFGGIEVDFDDEPDLAVDLSAFDDIKAGDSTDGAEEIEAKPDEGSGILGMVTEMVAPLLEGVEIDENWERWTVEPDEDSAGALSVTEADVDLDDAIEVTEIRSYLSGQERALLAGLSNLSGLIGLEDLVAGVLSIVHRQATELALAEAKAERVLIRLNG